MTSIRKVIVSHKADDLLIGFIHSLGIDTIPSKKNRQVMPQISDHPDVFVFSAAEGLIVEPSHYDYYNERLINTRIQKGCASVTPVYPGDSRYNAILLGDSLIHGPALDALVCSSAQKRIAVRQGYVKCNILAVDQRSLITSDRGIYRALHAIYDVLLIETGHILLDGMSHGFIGGAGGRISESQILFTGNIENHPDYLRIRRFIEERGMAMIYPESCELTDLGSVIPVYETEEE